MDKLSINREEAKKFLEEVAVPNYRTLIGFDDFVNNYGGENKEYLLKVASYLQKKNSRGDTRILGLGDSEIEAILEETIPAKVS